MLQTRIEELKQYAFVIKQLSLKEHKRKTDETNLGVFWNVLNPLLYMVILSTYYQNVIIHKIENFPVFVFTGVIVHNLYNAGMRGSMHSLVYNKHLLVRTNTPLGVYIIQNIYVAFKEFFFSSMALIPIMFFFHIPFSYRVVQIIPVLVLTLLTIYGAGKCFSIIYVYFADIDYLYNIFMFMMFFVSGVFMPINHMPERLQGILSYNPIFLSIYLTRNCLVYNLPSHWTAWTKLSLWTITLLLLGHYSFKNSKNKVIGKL